MYFLLFNTITGLLFLAYDLMEFLVTVMFFSDFDGRVKIVCNLAIGIDQRQYVKFDVSVDTDFRVLHVLTDDEVVTGVCGESIAEQGNIEHVEAAPITLCICAGRLIL